MDPLSAAASIIAVLQLAGTVMKYLSSVGDVSKDRKRIYSEVCEVDKLRILSNNATQAQEGDSWSLTLQSLCAANGPLEQFDAILRRLESKLVPAKGSKRIVAAMGWPFDKGEVNELLNAIEHQKTLFIFARQNDHM